MDGADGTDGFGREEEGFACFGGGGDFGSKALEGGLELRARCWRHEGEEEEVGKFGSWCRRHGWGIDP